jgi:OFA family oxalate/formate antiporter-like MFS transporter
MLWLILFLNVTAGISLISQQAPLFQELAGVTAVAAAGMVGVVSIGNAFGRIFWAWLSDLITRKRTLALLFVVQVVLFWFLPDLRSATVLTAVAFLILMCYGGGFGTMPACTADYFGPRNVGPIYGLMLTAWGLASVFGPLMMAEMRQTTGSYRGALHIIAGIMAVSMLLPLALKTLEERQPAKV